MTENLGFRKILVYLLLAAVVTVIIYVLFQGPSTIGDKPDDFVGYWTAGRLIAFQENPYSIDNFIEINQGMGFETIVLLPVYYPPTVLPFLLPFGLIQFSISRYIWLLLSIIGIFLSGFFIWRLFRGPENKRWVVILCILTFTPMYFSLMEGQITFLILLGFVGFLFFVDERKWFIAGFFLTILTIKFQLVYLVWIIAVLWIVHEKRWKVLLGLLTSAAVLLAISIILQPSIIPDYVSFMLSESPSQCGYVSLSAFFCAISREGTRWIRYLPPLAGAVWGVIFYLRHKDGWIWKERISIILLVSLMTAPLTWMHDQLLLLIPVIEIAILIIGFGKIDQKVISVLAVYLIMNIAAFIMIPNSRHAQHHYLWMPIVFLLLYVHSSRAFRRPGHVEI